MPHRKTAMGQFRRFARVRDWSGVPQELDVLATIRYFRVAPFPDIGVTRNQGAAIAERCRDHVRRTTRPITLGIVSRCVRSVKTPGQGAARFSSAGFQCQGSSSAICWAG